MATGLFSFKMCFVRFRWLHIWSLLHMYEKRKAFPFTNHILRIVLFSYPSWNDTLAETNVHLRSEKAILVSVFNLWVAYPFTNTRRLVCVTGRFSRRHRTCCCCPANAEFAHSHHCHCTHSQILYTWKKRVPFQESNCESKQWLWEFLDVYTCHVSEHCPCLAFVCCAPKTGSDNSNKVEFALKKAAFPGHHRNKTIRLHFGITTDVLLCGRACMWLQLS